VGFTAQRLDTSTGLMFYQARYYDPATARSISADTIVPDPGNPQDFNRYSYVRNNPVMLIDPSGNCSRIAKQMENAAAEQGVSIDLGSGDDCPDSFSFWGDVRNIGKGIIDTPANLVNLNLQFAEVTDRWFVMSPTGGGPVGFAYRRWFAGESAPVRVPTFGADPGYEAEYLAGAVIGPAVWAKGLQFGGAFGSRLAARFGDDVVLVGKVDDLAGPGVIGPGEITLIEWLPNRGSPSLNWEQNSSVLRPKMSRGIPIRDVSVEQLNGNLINNTGFPRAERNLLMNRGWRYDFKTTFWYPPG
jgi:RHS repeat-associated protein